MADSGIGRDPLAYMGSPNATEVVRGVIEIATVAETVAGLDDEKAVTPLGLAAVAIAGAPDASTSQKGIIQIATDGEAALKIASDLALVPSNIPAILAAPGGIGGTTPGAGAFTTLSASGAFSLTGDTVQVAEGGTGASSLTDHGILLGSGTGAVTVTAVGTNNQLLIGQSAADPIWSDNIDIPGTLDVTGVATFDDTATFQGAVVINAGITIDSLIVDDITIDANEITSSGNLDLTSSGGAISINSTAGAINVASDADNFALNLGNTGARTITLGNVTGATGIVARVGTGNFSLDGVTNSTYTVGASTTTGTISIGGTAQTGDMTIAGGTGAQTINIANSTGGKTVAIATGAGANTVTIGSTNTTSTTTIQAGSGGVVIGDAAAGAVTINSAANISLDAATASNFTVTGAGQDLSIVADGGSLRITSTEDAAQAVYVRANGGTSETVQIHADQGTGTTSVYLLSDVGGITFEATGLASDDAINLEATAGGIDIDAAMQINIQSTEAQADAIVINSSNAAGGIDLLTGGGEISIGATGGNVTLLPATNSAAGTSLTLNARVGVATFTGQTTAAGSTITLTITNSFLGAGDGIFCTVSNKGSNDAQMTLTRVNTETAGTLIVQADNNGAAALNGDIIVTFWIIN